MALKYPNKRKRKGYWKTYERANIKDYLLVWNTILALITPQDIPFRFAKRGRKPKLSPQEYVAMAVLGVYFDLRFRETEFLVALLSGKHLDHSNCVRWFGRLTVAYIDQLAFQVHQHILEEVPAEGDYIADASLVTCDRLKSLELPGTAVFEHITWKMHLLVMYLVEAGLLSIVSIFPTEGRVHESPVLRRQLLKEDRLIEGRKCHADKAYFGRSNMERCRDLDVKPNMVPKNQKYSDAYLKRYIKQEYDEEARKKNRGLVEGVFGGFQTETDMKIRCRKPHHRNVHVALMGLKHNIRTYLRTKVLMILWYFAPTPL